MKPKNPRSLAVKHENYISLAAKDCCTWWFFLFCSIFENIKLQKLGCISKKPTRELQHRPEQPKSAFKTIQYQHHKTLIQFACALFLEILSGEIFYKLGGEGPTFDVKIFTYSTGFPKLRFTTTHPLDLTFYYITLHLYKHHIY